MGLLNGLSVLAGSLGAATASRARGSNTSPAGSSSSRVFGTDGKGNAAKGAGVGDYVNTAGGLYKVVSPGTYGANYNPKNGLWSLKVDPNNTGYAQAGVDERVDRNNAFNSEQADISRDWSLTMNAKQNAFNSSEAAKAREWSERMANTAHQREVQDLIKAGLNPILAANNGAVTPSAVSASGSTPSSSMASADPSSPQALASMTSSLTSKLASIASSTIAADASRSVAKLYNDTNMKINDKSLAMQHLIAELNAATGLQQSAMSAGAMTSAAAMSAGATRYASLQSAAASRYGAEQAAAASKYGSDKAYKSSALSPSKAVVDVIGKTVGGAESVSKALRNAFSFDKNAAKGFSSYVKSVFGK